MLIGDLNKTVKITSNDEIKDLVATVNWMTENLRATAALAEKVGRGDLSVQREPLSDKDTARTMTTPTSRPMPRV